MVGPKVIKAFQQFLDEVADDGKFELAQQGHKATGKGIASIVGEITRADFELMVGVIYAEDYLMPVDTGVSASRIPFGGGSGRKSKYIEGLLRWVNVIKPGLSNQESLSFVFATAHAHKREGNPTSGSFSFSKNGRRKGWIENGLDKGANDEKRLERLLEVIPESFDTALAEASRAA